MNYAESGSGNCTYNLGRLTSVNTSALGALPAINESMGYDALGRVCSSSEAVGSVIPNPFSYGYNLASGLSSETYPSSRALNFSFDAQNRAIGATGTGTTYANSAKTSYASNDLLAQLQLGPTYGATAPIATEAFTFDPIRWQTTGISMVSGDVGGASLLGLTYKYCG